MDPHAACYVLGIPPGSNETTARLAYRRLIAAYHPDRNSDGHAHDRTQQINRAWATLERAGFPETGAPASSPAKHEPPPPRYRSAYFLHTVHKARACGRDVRRKARLTIEQAALGAVLAFTAKRTDLCATCRGRGFVGEITCQHCAGRRVEPRRAPGQPHDCGICHGVGRLFATCGSCEGRGLDGPRTRRYKIKIPAGVRPGDRLLVEGQGGCGIDRPGNMILTVEFAPHRAFFMDHDGILAVRVPRTVGQLIDGDPLLVPTPWGYRHVRPNESAVEISGSGLPRPNGGPRDPLRVYLFDSERPSRDEVAFRLSRIFNGPRRTPRR